jgi:hypothetical protein
MHAEVILLVVLLAACIIFTILVVPVDARRSLPLVVVGLEDAELVGVEQMVSVVVAGVVLLAGVDVGVVGAGEVVGVGRD